MLILTGDRAVWSPSGDLYEVYSKHPGGADDGAMFPSWRKCGYAVLAAAPGRLPLQAVTFLSQLSLLPSEGTQIYSFAVGGFGV